MREDKVSNMSYVHVYDGAEIYAEVHNDREPFITLELVGNSGGLVLFVWAQQAVSIVERLLEALRSMGYEAILRVRKEDNDGAEVGQQSGPESVQGAGRANARA